jgi:hypothetical protein
MSAIVTQTNAKPQPAATSGAVPEIVLQPGTNIDARVLAVRENLARILIAGLSLEVLTEVALQPGANLKLAVSQTADGTVRLAVVSQDAAAPGQAAASPASGAVAAATNAPARGTVATELLGSTALPRVAAPPTVPASPEAQAISVAVQSAAPRQAGLAPLFANLPVIVVADGVPPQVQKAASQLLATRLPLDTALNASELRQGLQKSGLLLEATLARGVAPAGAPDLKAALVVFRQVLTSWLGSPAPAAQISPQAVLSPATPAAPQALPQAMPQSGVQVAAQLSAAALTLTAAMTPAPTVPSAAAPVARPAVMPVIAEPGATLREASPALQVTAPNVAAAPVEIIRTVTQALAQNADVPLREPASQRDGDEQAAKLPPQQNGQSIATRPSAEPAPPFRGAMPSPQPVAAPTLAPDTAPASMGQQLLEQTDAALARQTLLQVASLPDRPELGGANQTTQPRWSFEIPFATPQGTAMAQFEIERDGGNDVGASAPSRVWRARFTLDVEPTGPIHALVSLIGEKTAVRMWAERPETAAQLRANTEALGQALRQAELEPGDILVGEGAPARPKPRAGRFLDRAT